MKPKSFVILVAATTVCLAAAVYAVATRTADNAPEAADNAPLIPGLSDRLNQVVALTVKSGTGPTTTISRPAADSDAWADQEKAGYPVAADQLRRILLALAEAKTLEPRTARPDQYAKLAVDDAGALRVLLRTADGQTLPALLVGKTATADSFYARRTEDARSWLAQGKLAGLAADPMQWLDRSLPALPAERVIAVTVDRPGAVLSITRKDPKDKDFTVTGLAANAKLNQSVIARVAGAAEFLSFEDVARLDPTEKPTADTVTTTFRTADGDVLAIRIDRHDGKPWANFSGESGTSTPKLDLARFGSWRYRLPDYTAKDLTPGPEDLVEKPAAAAPPQP